MTKTPCFFVCILKKFVCVHFLLSCDEAGIRIKINIFFVRKKTANTKTNSRVKRIPGLVCDLSVRGIKKLCGKLLYSSSSMSVTRS